MLRHPKQLLSLRPGSTGSGTDSAVRPRLDADMPLFARTRPPVDTRRGVTHAAKRPASGPRRGAAGLPAGPRGHRLSAPPVGRRAFPYVHSKSTLGV
jgi:hypothetical protein